MTVCEPKKKAFVMTAEVMMLFLHNAQAEKAGKKNFSYNQ